MSGALTGTAVLVAEDDPDNAELLVCLIEHEGGVVRAAKSAREVLEILVSWTPDVLLLDISLPDMDGYELLGHIRLRPGLLDVPAIAVTGYGHDDKLSSTSAGFATHVTKPFDGDALLEIVAKFAAKRAS
jgi:two-component system CheB/CheR fusion protein